ncbi:MAG: L-serine ammonia-lyase, partial [Acidobacteriota bacterium]
MAISVFDLFSLGIGPSSSHTVGPMRATLRFARGLADDGQLDSVDRVQVELYGSLAATGRGHGTPQAVVTGLLGEEPETVDPGSIEERYRGVLETGRLSLLGERDVDFGERDLVFKRKVLPFHANGLKCLALDGRGNLVRERSYYSVGGGFVVNDDEASTDRIVEDQTEHPYPFDTGEELLALCRREGLAIWQVMMENEKVWRPEPEIRRGLLELAQAMRDCVRAGCTTEGTLPGGLEVKRRASRLYRELVERPEDSLRDPLAVLDWVSCFAIAVNEENAAGGRVVTAPTNGAAGIVPAVLEYYRRFITGADDDGIVHFLLTAGAIAILFKKGASISGAEVGCQGEVGVACSMAAGGLAEVAGLSVEQV